MKKTIFALALVLTAAGFAMAQKQDPKTAAKLIQMDRDWTAAEVRGDKAAAGAFVASDYFGTGADGVTQNRQQYIDAIVATPGDKDVADDYRVVFYGNTAVMTHRGTVTGKNPTVYRSTHVWVKNGAKWQIVAHHGGLNPTAN
jgi:hypothetical protein